MNKTLNIQNIKLPSKQLKRFFLENKEEIKGQTLPNGMKITGVGKKCLKIGNNFVRWEDIVEDTTSPFVKSALTFLFEDYEEDTEEDHYTTRKFTRAEANNNFDKVKEEIITHKEYYKHGILSGIGENALMIGSGYEKEFVNWDKVQQELETNRVQDTFLLSRDSYLKLVLKDLFIDDEEETETEKQIRETEDRLAEEKCYVYRHIIAEDLRVDDLRTIIYNRYNRGEAENLINDLLQFAFKYVREVKVTDDDYDEEEANKYAVKNGDAYIYVIKNKEVIFDEEREMFRFKDYHNVTFKGNKYSIQLFRYGKQVAEKPATHPIYVLRRKTTMIPIAYELSVEQQLHILEEEGNIRKLGEEEVRDDFLKTARQETVLAEEIREATKQYDSLEDAYENSEAIQKLAIELGAGGIHESIFYHVLEAVRVEQDIDKDKIMQELIWADGGMKKINLMDEKYCFKEGDIITKTDEYTYSQNCENTRIEQSNAYIDSIEGTIIYLRGDVSFEEAKKYLSYVEGVSLTSKKGYIYEDKEKDITVIL